MATPCVIVIDTDVWLYRALCVLLERRGYRVLHQPDPAEAVAAVRRQQPILVITALHGTWDDMGLDVVWALRDDPATTMVPILILSSDRDVEWRVASLRCPNVFALATHIEIARFLPAVDRLLAPDGSLLAG